MLANYSLALARDGIDLIRMARSLVRTMEVLR